MKSEGTSSHNLVKLLMANATPGQAFAHGRTHEVCVVVNLSRFSLILQKSPKKQKQMRPDWDEVRDEVMEKAVYAKFHQNEELKKLLLSTGSHPLVQLKPNDEYWGTGRHGKGANKLGVILEKVRGRLRPKDSVQSNENFVWVVCTDRNGEALDQTDFDMSF
eukprot:TRINITY_DN1928_c0_g1_i6.p1 TRINITY_DN1928_c0_g1~~TRINITY_DN1928_c0_g1_i6.p1  ORF type:complete len:162 (+),score=44.41 TRINITY_DN1928_c0_g1_i6:575-1060(+)